VSFILSAADPNTGLWEVAQEPFFYEDAGGYVHYHQNTLCDVLVALADIGYSGPEPARIVRWLLDEMQPSGLWPLSSPNWRSDEIVTWSTAELILALHYAGEVSARDAFLRRADRKSTRVVQILTGIALLGWVGFGLVLIAGSARLGGVRHLRALYDTNVVFHVVVNIVVVVLALGVVAGVGGNFAYDMINRRRNQRRVE
jgi:hypothetical protein